MLGNAEGAAGHRKDGLCAQVCAGAHGGAPVRAISRHLRSILDGSVLA